MGAVIMPTALQRQTQNLEGYGTPVYGCQTLHVIGHRQRIILEELPTYANSILKRCPLDSSCRRRYSTSVRSSFTEYEHACSIVLGTGSLWVACVTGDAIEHVHPNHRRHVR